MNYLVYNQLISELTSTLEKNLNIKLTPTILEALRSDFTSEDQIADFEFYLLATIFCDDFEIFDTQQEKLRHFLPYAKYAPLFQKALKEEFNL